MRAFLPAYDMRQAASLQEALSLMAEAGGGWRPFAGGTDLMVLLESGALPRGRYVSLWGLEELRGVNETPTEVAIGALTTYAEIRNSGVLAREFPLLGRAATETGGLAIQNRGTLAGNIANASPAADSPPALLVYDAQLELASLGGGRRVPYERFHLGYKQMDLAPDELIARIILPRGRRGWREYYRKVGTRRAQAISKVCMAGAIRLEDGRVHDVRIALGSVAPVPLRCVATEAALRGTALDEEALADAGRALSNEISPIDDVRSTSRYRRQVALNLLREFLVGNGSVDRATSQAT
ncbi:MAG TPA: xanthine dehydrogenase family protein subunit M [Vicinamibacterales bacterium]|nr:xanthine dehydrogenase family protein subunit M [Vicinamibacterales bacterium]